MASYLQSIMTKELLEYAAFLASVAVLVAVIYVVAFVCEAGARALLTAVSKHVSTKRHTSTTGPGRDDGI
jgi:autotransporter translocation and assembly factor TamB